MHISSLWHYILAPISRYQPLNTKYLLSEGTHDFNATGRLLLRTTIEEFINTKRENIEGKTKRILCLLFELAVGHILTIIKITWRA